MYFTVFIQSLTESPNIYTDSRHTKDKLIDDMLYGNT